MSLAQEYDVLRRVPFFAEIEPAKLKLLAFMSERVGFDPGKTVCRQGDRADAAYLIIDGEADIILEGPAGPIRVTETTAGAPNASALESPAGASVTTPATTATIVATVQALTMKPANT